MDDFFVKQRVKICKLYVGGDLLYDCIFDWFLEYIFDENKNKKTVDYKY